MAILDPSGLRTHDYAAPGWHITYNFDVEKLNETLGNLIATEKVEVDDLDPAATLADVITKVNVLLGILRDLGIIKE